VRTRKLTVLAISAATVAAPIAAAPAGAQTHSKMPAAKPVAMSAAGAAGSAATTGTAATAGWQPTLAQLPGALVSGQSALTVAVPANPSADVLRAAIAAAGAVQKAAGGLGIAVNVVEGSAPQALSAPGGIISINETPAGPGGSLAVQQLANGHVLLNVSGTGSALMNAARVLSSPAIATLTGSASAVPAGLAPQQTSDPVPTGVVFNRQSVSGTGQLSLTASFRLPVEREFAGNAPLDLGIGFNDRNGGQANVTLNGGPVGSVSFGSGGPYRIRREFGLSNDPTLAGNLVPGWLAIPGANEVKITATASSHATLRLLRGSSLSYDTVPRKPILQLALWPFPIYDQHAWSDTTVVLPQSPGISTLSAVVTALSNTERVTTLPADPQLAFGVPTADERAGNVMYVGAPATQFANTVHGLTGPRTANVLHEVRIPNGGGVALLAFGDRSLSVLGQGYFPLRVVGSAAIVGAKGNPITLSPGASAGMFQTPKWPWLVPSAFLALLAFGYVAVRTRRARRRLVTLTPFEVPA
jgi:hypothetical protein